MRICLLTHTYPPASTEGIPRQRQALAAELARLGHEVHVVTCGARRSTHAEGAVTVHQVPADRVLRYSPSHTALDEQLTHSQALYAGLLELDRRSPVDVVDVPLWEAQGFVTHQRFGGTTVLWLQTTSAQLLAIAGRRPGRVDRWRLDLERICLQRANGLLADSRAALESTVRDYHVRSAAPAGIVYLGLPELPGGAPERPERERVEALVVGRLERRKGTPLLLGLLPDLLRRHPRLTVRFVGRDNSASDGWYARHGASYPEHFRARNPGLADRVLFDGYVDEARLAARYREADMLLAPSLYESFGLIYLEAMRARLPVVAFAAGGAAEIFARGEADGALLARAEDGASLAEAIGQLAGDSGLRRRLGAAGLERFRSGFTARAMAESTVRFYEQVLAQRAAPGGRTPVYQVMEALDEGDAVSDIARRAGALLADLGEGGPILARSAPAQLRGETAPLERALDTPASELIFHYWGYSAAIWMARAVRGRKALYYHNITPPAFFPRGSALRAHLERGYAQLAQIVGDFQLLTGDSRYNLRSLAPMLPEARPALHIYPVVERSAVQQAPYDRALLDRLRASGEHNLLFVGRIAPNKRQDRLMRAFDRYARAGRPARLWLVGSQSFDRSYHEELEQLRRSLPAGDRITLTGKLPDAAMMAHFRAADLLACASEHEGFCVPLAQAMALDVPVVALAAAAVPETIAGSPGLLDSWDELGAAEAFARALTDDGHRRQILAAQEQALERFSATAARERLAAIVRFLRTGEGSPLFETLVPEEPPP